MEIYSMIDCARTVLVCVILYEGKLYKLRTIKIVFKNSVDSAGVYSHGTSVRPHRGFHSRTHNSYLYCVIGGKHY